MAVNYLRAASGRIKVNILRDVEEYESWNDRAERVSCEVVE